MPKYLSNEQQWLGANPPTPAGDEAYNARARIFRATIPLDAPKLSPTQNGTSILTTDTVSLARIPAGMRFSHGMIVSSVSLGTSTIAVGTAADTAKYRAAATFTSADAPAHFGKAAATAAGPLAAEEEIILTVAVAALPNTANARLIVDLFFVGP
jgi:hypothetical protein